MLALLSSIVNIVFFHCEMTITDVFIYCLVTDFYCRYKYMISLAKFNVGNGV